MGDSSQEEPHTTNDIGCVDPIFVEVHCMHFNG
jgi:hypothetical protein